MLASVVFFMMLALTGWRIHKVRHVRYKRLRDCEEQHAHLLNDLDAMTYEEATEIMRVSHYWDMPWSMTLALSLALFNTYAIPSISAVLASSGELSQPATASRRAEDTAIVIGDFLTKGLDSMRGSVALARMNWLHSRWGSRIKQDDLLYTLSLFIFEPVTFCQRYEWRALTDLEVQARFIFWREVGTRMGIQDIPATSKEMWEWKEKYATSTMEYMESNAQIGALTMEVLVAPLPRFLKSSSKEAGKVLVEPRVMKAFGWQSARPAVLYKIVPFVMRCRALFIANLMMPRERRPIYLISREVSATGPDGKVETYIQREGFIFEPWYVPAGQSCIGKLGVGVPGGAKWRSEGYTSESIGPERLRHQGRDSVVAEGAAIRGCPLFS